MSKRIHTPGFDRVLAVVPTSKFRKPRKRRLKESSVEDKAIEHARDRGWLVRKMNGLGYMAWPDRYFIAPTKACSMPNFWVEFKRSGEEATLNQARMHKDLRGRGEHVFVIDNMRDFLKLFAKACK